MNTYTFPVKSAILKAFLLAGVLCYPFVVLFSYLNPNVTTPSIKPAYTHIEKVGFHIAIEEEDSGIKAIVADTANSYPVKVHVHLADGSPVKNAEIRMEASANLNSKENILSNVSIIDATIGEVRDVKSGNRRQDSASSPVQAGTFLPAGGITDENGIFTAKYIPPSTVSTAVSINLVARLTGTETTSSIAIKLFPVPVVLVHGYQASPDIFSGLSTYLESQGFQPSALGYASENGVKAGATALSKYLDKLKFEYHSNGILVNRFDLVGHSMGGLVVRYYSCSEEYKSKGNVRKLIFLSVPQRGSPFASIGLKYYDDQGIRDLLTDSPLYIALLPSMNNRGLNPSIETGSIMGRYDEVVSSESASLAEWNIRTEVFDVGDSNFTIDKLLSGEILQAANHKLILYNRKVYQRVKQMLETDLPYPLKR